jgi:hypothetical protein
VARSTPRNPWDPSPNAAGEISGVIASNPLHLNSPRRICLNPCRKVTEARPLSYLTLEPTNSLTGTARKQVNPSDTPTDRNYNRPTWKIIVRPPTVGKQDVPLVTLHSLAGPALQRLFKGQASVA